MSDPFLSMQRQIQALQDQIERTRKADTSPLYPPWAQNMLNPVALASSGNTWGDMGQPWAVNVIAFYASVYVVTTNNGTNFWTLTLYDAPGNALATLSTSAISANVFTRLSTTTITQPAASNTLLYIVPTATLSPGSIYIVPSVALLRTGN